MKCVCVLDLRCDCDTPIFDFGRLLRSGDKTLSAFVVVRLDVVFRGRAAKCDKSVIKV